MLTFTNKFWVPRKDKSEKTEEALNISRTRATKVAQTKYTEAHKEVKKIERIDKHRYIDNLAEVAEQAPATGNMKQL